MFDLIKLAVTMFTQKDKSTNTPQIYKNTVLVTILSYTNC